MTLNSWVYGPAGRFACELAPRDMSVGDIIWYFHAIAKHAVATKTVKAGEPVIFALYDNL